MNSHTPASFVVDVDAAEFPPIDAPIAAKSVPDPQSHMSLDSRALRDLARLAIDQLNAVKLRMRHDPTLTDAAHKKALDRIALQESYAWTLLDELSGRSNP